MVTAGEYNFFSMEKETKIGWEWDCLYITE